MAVKRLSIGLIVDDTQFQKGLRKASNEMKRFGKQISQTGATLSQNLTLPIIAAGVASVKMASDFEESLNKTRVAFGESSTEVEAFAKTTLKNFGLAEGSALDMASMFGDMATSMGLNQKQAAGMANSLVGLAGDLASFKNIGIEQAQTALAGIFTGETESLKKLGIVMTEANLKQFGYNKNMSQAEKIGIRYKAIIEATKNAQGDYLRTSDGVANSTRTLTESVKELATDFGTMLLPVASKLIAKGQALVDFFRNLSTEQKENIIQVAGIVAVVGPVVLIFGKFLTALGSITSAFRTLNIIVAMNPFTMLGIAVTGLVAILGFAVFDTERFIVTAIKMGTVGKTVAKMILSFLGTISPKYAIMAQNIDTMADALNDSNVDLEQSTKNLEDNQKAVGDLENMIGNFKAFEPLNVPVKFDFPKDDIDILDLPEPVELRVKVKKLHTELGEDFLDLGEEEQAVPFEFNAEQVVQDMNKMKEAIQQTDQTAGSAFMSMADNSEASLGEMGASAANAAREIIKIEAAKAVAGFASSIFATVPFPVNLMLAASAGAIAGSLFAKIIPPFAEGGLVSGATLGMVGEGRGTSMVNPEVIAPLDKLQGMLNQGGSTEVFGRISGSDILLSSDRARGNRKRTRGN